MCMRVCLGTVPDQAFTTGLGFNVIELFVMDGTMWCYGSPFLDFLAPFFGTSKRRASSVRGSIVIQMAGMRAKFMSI